MRESPLQKLINEYSGEIKWNNRDIFWDDITTANSEAKSFYGFLPINTELMQVNTKKILEYFNNQLIKTWQKEGLAEQLEAIIQTIVQAFSIDCAMNPAAKTEQDLVFLDICTKLNKILMKQGYDNAIAIATDLWTTTNPLLLKHSKDIKTQ